MRGRNRVDGADIFTYLYLVGGTLLMFLPVVWLALSSFKTPAALVKFPPDLLPYSGVTVNVARLRRSAPLFDVTMEDGSVRRLAQVRRVGIEAQMVDPDNPDEIVRVPISERTEVNELRLAWENYLEPLRRFNFLVYLRNSVVVTAGHADHVGDQ
ncbi:MAG: hypothetical protein R2856_18065 [Caldilineaceae bacterium]